MSGSPADEASWLDVTIAVLFVLSVLLLLGVFGVLCWLAVR